MRSEVQCLIQEISGSLLLSIYRAVAVEDGLPGVVEPDEPDDFDEAGRAFLAMLTEDQRRPLSAKVARDLATSASEKVAKFGASAARANLAVPISVGRQIEGMSVASRLSVNAIHQAGTHGDKRAARKLFDALEELAGKGPAKTPPIDPRPQDRPPAFVSAVAASVADPEALADLFVARPTVATGVATGITPGFGPLFETNTDAIETKYIQTGGASGPLGLKLGPVVYRYDFEGNRYRIQDCENGVVIYSHGNEAHCIWGAIYRHWQYLGAEDEPFLGVPIKDQQETPRVNGAYTGQFAVFYGGGAIYDSPSFGPREVHGAIRSRWGVLGFEKGWLGFPKSDELPSGEPKPIGPFGAWSAFRNGIIMWSRRHGAVEIHDDYDTVYFGMGRELGNLGYPVRIHGTPSNPKVYCEGGILGRDDAGIVRAMPLYTEMVSQVWAFSEQSTGEIDGRDEITMVHVTVDSRGRLSSQVRRRAISPAVGPITSISVMGIDLNDEPHPWPRTYTSIIMFREDDGGSADAFAQSVLNSVQSGLNRGIEAAATAIGVALGGPLGPIIGALLDAALSYAFDQLFDDLNSAFEDEVVFPPIVFSYRYDSLANWVPSVAFDDESGRSILTDVERTTSAGGGTLAVKHQWRRG